MKNLRLTCRKLCDASSRLLITKVIVDLTIPSSISRMVEISQHPTIRLGVLHVEVVLAFYSSTYANDVREFAGFYTLNMRKCASIVQATQEDWFHPGVSTFDKLGRSLEAAAEAMDKASMVVSSWSYFHRDGHWDQPEYEGEERYQSLLERSHQEYRRLYNEQEALRGGAFVEAIATAFSTMPSARSLRCVDQDENDTRGNFRLMLQQMDDENVIVKDMFKPLSWGTAGSSEPGSPPVEILLALPSAILRAGSWLTSFNIGTSLPRDLTLFAASAGTMQGLNRLESFGLSPLLDCNVHAFPPVDLSGVSQFRTFLSAILNTPTLKRLELNFRDLNTNRTSFSLSSLVEVCHWPSLTYLRLQATSIHFEELVHLTECWANPISLGIEDINLLSGTWADALDLLRNRCTESSGLAKVSGGECDVLSWDDERDIFWNIDDEDGEWYYEGGPDGYSKAEEYVKGFTDQNPLKTVK